MNPAGLKIRKTYEVKCFKIKVSTITASNLNVFPSRSYNPLDKTKACIFLLGESTINALVESERQALRVLGTYPHSPTQNLTERGSVLRRSSNSMITNHTTCGKNLTRQPGPLPVGDAPLSPQAGLQARVESMKRLFNATWDHRPISLDANFKHEKLQGRVLHEIIGEHMFS